MSKGYEKYLEEYKIKLLQDICDELDVDYEEPIDDFD